MFSNKEQKVYLEKYVASPSNHRINAITAKIRCRLCSGEQVNERQCEGPCGEWKALDKFSKAQRTRGSGWCQECVLWKEAAEPGVVTEAAPNTMLAPDEYDETALLDEPVARNYSGISYSGVDLEEGPEYGHESDDDYNYQSTLETALSTLKITPYLGIATGMAGLNVEQQPHIAINTTQGNTSTTSKVEYIPPHLRNSVSSAAGTATGYIPPHMRGNASKSTQLSPETAVSSRASEVTASSASNPYEPLESTYPGRPWSAVDARRRVPGPITFNGFENNGVRHTQQRVASGTTSTVAQPAAPVVPSTAPVAPTRRGNWAKAVSNSWFSCFELCETFM